MARTEKLDDKQWWYLSFASEEGFLGACFVGPAGDQREAAMLAYDHGCNPGGEVLGGPIGDDIDRVPMADRDRLLTLADLKRLDPDGVVDVNGNPVGAPNERKPIEPLHADSLGDYEIVTAQIGPQFVTLIMARVAVRTADSPQKAAVNHHAALQRIRAQIAREKRLD